MATAARTESPAPTAVATTPKPGTVAERIEATRNANRDRNALVAAIRGTLWGRDTTPELARYVAQYCRDNNLDAVRHVELLGGRIYLTAELYDEKGAPLIRDGVVVPDEPDYVNVDERLTKLATDGDVWAVEEQGRRLRARIEYNIPEKAAASVIQRFTIPSSGATIVGVNWCGGGVKASDPVGNAEPAKTAQTRARRRAWKQIADIIPGYAEIIRPLEASARVASEQMPIAVVEAEPEPKALVAGNGTYEAPASTAAPAAKEPAAKQPALCGRCNEPHAYKDGEDLGNDAGTCFRFAAKE